MKKILIAILWIISIHSLLVGFVLIASPEWLFNFLSFKPSGNFFPVQGGVFYIVMAIVYALAACNVNKYKSLVIFSISAKFITAIFLFIYFSFAEHIWSILVFAITDGLLGLALLIAFFFYELNKALSDIDIDIKMPKFI